MTMLLEPLPHYYKSESSFKYVLCVFLDLLEIDGQMAPQDKLACLVKCSKNIFEILKVSNENPASADDFLPCLIYICLKANPPRFVSYILISFLLCNYLIQKIYVDFTKWIFFIPRIQSNINYITRFCNESKIRMGEGGYFFANLVRNDFFKKAIL